MTPAQEAAFELALECLARGTRRKPSARAVWAAMGYVIREDMSRTLIEGLEAGELDLRWDPTRRELLVLLDPRGKHGARDGAPMVVARVPRRGVIEYT